ncbi:6-phosphogluconolactonase [Micrococcales bacterium 31B]|nr:6-phosphogluconolactonase [Micrococcales bacterium 31B]
MTYSVLRAATGDDVAREVAARVIAHLAAALDTHDVANLVLTGGTVGIKTVKALSDAPGFGLLDWSRVHIWWGDERFVEADSPDRNAVQAREFLATVPQASVHMMPAFVPGANGSQREQAGAGASAYSASMRAVAHGDALRLDVLLLGMGPDGHVASLFPGHEVQFDGGDAIAVADSPKPPPHRISLTFEALNRAKHTYLVVAGADKGEAVAACLRATERGALHAPERAIAPSLGEGPLSAAFVGAHGEVVWALDDAVRAAAGLAEAASA